MPEKIIIGISVENKIAKADKNAVIVCGNSNYKAVFAFDGEWENYNVKTALFATDKADNDGNGTIAVVFEGNECDIPPLENTTIVGVGVASGDITQGEAVELATTTPAYIDCLLSIKDLGGVIAPPAPDVYDQIIALLNKYLGQGGGGSGETGGGLTEAEVKEIVQAETQGLQPKVDDGLETESKSVVGAINETNSKALATIESSIADGTYSVKLVFQNAKGEAIAETTLDLPLSEFVKFTDYATASKAGVVKQYYNKWASGIDFLNYGTIKIAKAENTEINGKVNEAMPIVPKNLDYAVKVGITTNTETLTDEEKAAACGWLGAFPNVLTDLVGDGYIPFYNPNTEKYGYKRAYGAFIGKNAVVMRDGNGDIHGKTATAESAGTVLVNKEYVEINKGTKLYKHTITGFVGGTGVIDISSVTLISTSNTQITGASDLDLHYTQYVVTANTAYGKVVNLVQTMTNEITMQFHSRPAGGEVETVVLDASSITDTVEGL